MKNITFEKYQGNGNDFVVIDSRGNDLFKNHKANKIFDIKKICNRQFGIGADGVIFIEEPLSLIHISEPTRRTPISYAVFCLKKKKNVVLD